MATDTLLLRQTLVCGSGLVYWGGVLVQARRIRRRIGRSPNLRPRTPKEKALWMGWMIVILGWILQPFFLRSAPTMHLALVIGVSFILLGYAATLWTYSVMGSSWRLGVDPHEKNKLVTSGPFSAVRHPIYVFQMIMLIGVFLLLPTALSLAILIIHFVCVMIKTHDEEAYLETIYGNDYRNYKARTGRLFPKAVI
jgi:protein-S-isoprenylcysteine O-methyltransferase Ste14